MGVGGELHIILVVLDMKMFENHWHRNMHFSAHRHGWKISIYSVPGGKKNSTAHVVMEMVTHSTFSQDISSSISPVQFLKFKTSSTTSPFAWRSSGGFPIANTSSAVTHLLSYPLIGSYKNTFLVKKEKKEKKENVNVQ